MSSFDEIIDRPWHPLARNGDKMEPILWRFPARLPGHRDVAPLPIGIFPSAQVGFKTAAAKILLRSWRR